MTNRINTKEPSLQVKLETYKSVVQYAMLLDDLDHPRNLFLRVPLSKGLLINTLCSEMVCREFEQWLGLLLSHGEFYVDEFWIWNEKQGMMIMLGPS